MTKQELLENIEQAITKGKIALAPAIADKAGLNHWQHVIQAMITDLEPLLAATADPPDEGECAKALRSIIDGFEDVPELHDGQSIGEISYREFRAATKALASHKPTLFESACAVVLREIEWIKTAYSPMRFCPSCLNQETKTLGHAPDCALAAVLRGERKKCEACEGTGRTDNHVTGEIECSACEGTGESQPQPAEAVVRALRETAEDMLQAIDRGNDLRVPYADLREALARAGSETFHWKPVAQ